MRIWDVNPGYLNRQSLLGEHRELHGIASIISHNKKKGYSRQPETRRWVGHGWALTMRHNLLAAEMELRNFNEHSPVRMTDNKNAWPPNYIDAPIRQFALLAEKYRKKEKGRISLPQTAQQLWSQHKYSILARDISLYKEIGRTVAHLPPDGDFSALARLLTETLRNTPCRGGIVNAVQYMWGHVADHYPGSREQVCNGPLSRLFATVQELAMKINEPYLCASTALSKFKIWL